MPARILVVDDDAAVRMTLETVLQRAAYSVTSAEDGAAGWERLRAEAYDLLITDHDMPALTGLALLRKVRAHSPTIPVILTSDSSRMDVAELLRLLPPGTTLPKPFSVASLLANVRICLHSAGPAEGPGPLPSTSG